MELDLTAETISRVQSSKFSMNSFFSTITLAEDSNGFPNIVVSGNENETDSTGGAYLKMYTMSNDTSLYKNQPAELDSLEGFAVGDLNGNGWSDLVVDYYGEYNFASINPSDTSLSIEGVIGTPLGNNEFVSVDRSFYPQGDLNNDGYDDALLYVRNDDVFGQLRLEGVSPNGTVNYANPTEYLYNAGDYRVTRIEGTFTFGDISGNGLDDYGLIVSDGLSGSLDIYEGGSDGSATIGTIDLPGFVQYVTSGDFNVDGREDILMLISIDVGTDENPERSNELHFYQLGSTSPYHVIKGQDFQPGLDDYNNFIGTISNAGDINDDGLEDILVGAPFRGLTPIGIYYGSASLSLNPDAQVSFPENPDINYSFGWGGTLQGGFDFNGDGVDDFLIGNNNEVDLNDIPDGATFVNDGAIHVFYGSSGTNDFSGGADVTLKSDSSAYSDNTWHWIFGFNQVAHGDFNGDGATDLAIKPFRHIEFNDINQGRPGIHIFHGGANFDGQPDQVLPLLEEIHQPSRLGTGSDTTAFSGRAEISAVPDINGDGADELLYIGPQYERNGSFFFGGDTLSSTPDAVLKAPNQSVGFNTNGNFINRQYRMSIGEMTASGVTSVLVWQQGDLNFMDTPAYIYELSQMAVSNEEPAASGTPKSFKLEQNYPNPFNPTTNIQFNIPRATDVTLKIYNILGQEVMTVLNDFKSAGTHTATFDAGNLASGIYIYRLQAGELSLQRRMTLIK
ncbi:MAG: T9SS type A sorting domain-containing protein [Gracilimonas sp.]|nr:T9SS type A sorting domain-containing protein [Gracilimonas sp.]MBO6616389.1 T9SS type A sorting domain-containing protein [Gracilimonas sp.]